MTKLKIDVKVGQEIYVETHLHISRGSDDVIGGRATVTKVTKQISGGEPCLFVEVAEHPDTSYNWSQHLSKEQTKLKKEFGEKRAYPDPDVDTPWIEDGDWVSFDGENSHEYHGDPIW